MSYVLSTVYADKWLDALLGGDHAANMPATVYFHLYTDDPANGGTELAVDGGYAAITLTNDAANFPAASGGIKTSLPQTWTFTGPTSDVATFGVISDGTVLILGGPLSSPCNPSTSGDTFTDSLSATFADVPDA